ncbi:uncharacterized protein LOC110810974 [Carica papaya]|uniref:uncharacterized protein LOC110810974 n=1 Tax=Carica papaya TaxID=3649 RepID=UPI000B8C7775|nr:uncharacterized protein LOC110810974 [Carica papaya]XP_021892999.1 uncharacterized protein LOC110810974 [Carica papaya]
MDAPSFSLGIDLDDESEFRTPTINNLPPFTSPDSSGLHTTRDGEDLGPQVADSDPEPETYPSRQVFKRLKRGLNIEKSSTSNRESEPLSRTNGGDDDIEEFSSQEGLRGANAPTSTQYNSVCGSSKVSLHGHGVLTSQSTSQWNVRKRAQPLDAPVSDGLGTIHSRSIFPKLTVSPLRRFQLLDSDSDDPSVSEDACRGADRNDLSSNGQEPSTNSKKKKESVGMPRIDDLWKNFRPNSYHISTPALDDVCEEYFHSVKNNDVTQENPSKRSSIEDKSFHQSTNTSQNYEQCWDFAEPLPSAHKYFFHNDPRIQRLVRRRLPNFFPLGTVNKGEQASASVIDYVSQFSNKEASKRGGTQKIIGKQSSGRKNKSKQLQTEENLPSEGWVDPKKNTAIPKDAGRRRVQAQGQSAGSWYTSPEGRKVYVTKNGQELTGQIAYRQYKKDSGGKFGKSKKKKNTKK